MRFWIYLIYITFRTMKNQIIQNVFKLMLGTSALLVSVAFFIRTISPVQASGNVILNDQPSVQVPLNEDGSINVKLSDEQLKELKVNAVGKFDFYIVSKSGTLYGHKTGGGGSSYDWDAVDDINKAWVPY
jgi:hypothetical protein